MELDEEQIDILVAEQVLPQKVYDRVYNEAEKSVGKMERPQLSNTQNIKSGPQKINMSADQPLILILL